MIITVIIQAGDHWDYPPTLTLSFFKMARIVLICFFLLLWKKNDQKQLGQERTYLPYRLSFIIREEQGRNVESGTEAEPIEEHCLGAHPHPHGFVQPTILYSLDLPAQDWTDHSVLCPSTLISNWENTLYTQAHRPTQWGQFNQGSLLPGVSNWQLVLIPPGSF